MRIIKRGKRTTCAPTRGHLEELVTKPMSVAAAFRMRHDLRARKILTVGEASEAKWVMEKLKPHIRGKTVVEIGAGIGVLALEMAKVAKRVYAIEPDPEYTWRWVNILYEKKPDNLTWIFARAESLVGTIRGDVAVMLTGSGEDYFRKLAGKFAPKVAMPWQDHRGGRAVITNYTSIDLSTLWSM